MFQMLFVSLLLFAVATAASADDYKLSVKLQEFSGSDGRPIDLEKVLSTPSAFKKLTPGDVIFLHKTCISTGQELENSVQTDSTEAQMSYRVGEERDDLVYVSATVTISKVLAVRGGIPIKSTQSIQTSLNCPVGQDVPISGADQGDNKTINMFVITVDQ